LFFGSRRKYFIDYFCTEMTTRIGALSPRLRQDVEGIVDRAIAEIKRLGLNDLDTGLGEAVVDPEGPAARKTRLIHGFATRTHAENAERWRAEGVAPVEIARYWDLGVLSHICYSEFDNYFDKAMGISTMQDQDFADRDFADIEEAISAAQTESLKQWPLYGPVSNPHLKMDECDRPLPVEARLWVDQLRFRAMNGDAEQFQDILQRYSSFNAFARFARAADSDLAAELASNRLPAPTYGLAPLSPSDRHSVVLDDDEMDDAGVEDYEEAADADEEEWSEEDDENEDIDERSEIFTTIPDTLRWPIPVRLGDEAEALYAEQVFDKHEVTYSEFVTLPCARALGDFYVAGVLAVAWLDEPNIFNGQHLHIDFKQNEDIDAGLRHRQLLISLPVSNYVVETSEADYYHRSEYMGVNIKLDANGVDGRPKDKSDLGLWLASDTEDEAYVIPWSTGGLSEVQKEMILDRLKTVLLLLDRHIASREPNQTP